jgi:hypothetical protein
MPDKVIYMANIPSVSNRGYFSTEFKKTFAAMFVCVAMTLAVLAVTEPIFADDAAHPRPTPPECPVCLRMQMGHKMKQKTEIIHCDDVPMFLAQHPGSCAGPCPCNVTGVQNP